MKRREFLGAALAGAGGLLAGCGGGGGGSHDPGAIIGPPGPADSMPEGLALRTLATLANEADSTGGFAGTCSL